VERGLGLMCGAGVLPALIAGRARRQGWRLVAFTFPGAPDMSGQADRTIPSRFTDAGPILESFQEEGVSAAVLCGKFAMRDVLRAEAEDAVAREMAARAGSRIDVKLVEIVISTFASVGVEVLDQRTFLADLLATTGCWSRRRPTGEEWDEIRRGLGLARMMADARIGQTVVLRRGAVTAVEAAEGTTEAVRRGTALGGPGAVIVKAAARDHDYRFDTPVIGEETVAVAAAGRAAVLAVEAGRVLVLDREATARAADAAGLALVGMDDAS
jgi:hypothetical protein